MTTWVMFGLVFISLTTLTILVVMLCYIDGVLDGVQGVEVEMTRSYTCDKCGKAFEGSPPKPLVDMSIPIDGHGGHKIQVRVAVLVDPMQADICVACWSGVKSQALLVAMNANKERVDETKTAQPGS